MYVLQDVRSSWSVVLALFIVVGFVIIEVIALMCVGMILKILEAKKSNFSRATYRLHRQLTISLGLQVGDTAIVPI